MTVNTLVFDEDQVISFLESVARAKALERHVKIRWKDYEESAVLNFIYTVMWWKGKPGTLEVDLGDQKQIEAETATDTYRLLEMFVMDAALGAERVVRFLKGQQDVRETCQQTVEAAFREVQTLSAEMIAETQRAIAKLAVIKCAATITLKAAALAGGGIPAFLIGTGYDLSLKLIKDWDQAPAAKLVGITSKFADKVGKKVIKGAAENVAYIYKQEEMGPARKAEWLRKRVEQAEEELAKEFRSDRMKKLARDSRRLARASQEASRARWAARALTSVKFLFFAKDAYDALKDAHDTIRQAGY